MEDQGPEKNAQNASERTKRILDLAEKGKISEAEATLIIDREDAQKQRKPSLLQQKVNSLVARGMPEEAAKAEVARLEGERRRTAVLDELTLKDAKIMKPACPGCGADPLVLKRLRYEFGDGVIVEVLFCHNPECRIAIGSQIVFIPQSEMKR